MQLGDKQQVSQVEEAPQSSSQNNLQFVANDLDSFKIEVAETIHQKFNELKSMIPSTVGNESVSQMTSQNNNEIMNGVLKSIDKFNDFFSIHEMNRKGYQKIEEWLEIVTMERQRDSLGQCKLYVHEAMKENEKNTVTKIDQFVKEQLILKAQMENFKDFRLQLSNMQQKLDEKASYQNLRNLEYQLEDYVKLNNLDELFKTLSAKVDQEEFARISDEFRLVQAQVEALRNKFSVQAQSHSQFELQYRETLLEEEKRVKGLEDELKKNIADLTSRIFSVRDQLRNYIKEEEAKWNECYKKMDDKASLNELDKLRCLLDKYATNNALRDLRKEIIPDMKSFHEKINEFTNNNDQMKEMIRRFDEVLSEKASKMAIHEVEFFIENNYVKKRYWDKLQEEINSTIEQQQQTVKVMQDSVKMFEVNMSEEINAAVKKSLSKAMSNYEKVLNQFQKFFDQEELSKVLERKADIDYVQTLQDIKANKLDLEGCIGLIESIHERVKHLSILQVEMARSLIPVKTSSNFNSTESINSKINRMDFLLKQAQVTSQWVNDFSIKQLLPGEDEMIQNDASGKQQNRAICFSDVPSPIRQFEKFHQSVQEKQKTDLPQTLKRWKQQLSQRSSLSTAKALNSQQQSSFINSSLIQDEQLAKPQHFGPKQSLQHIALRRHRKSNQSMRINLNYSPKEQTAKDDNLSLIFGSGDVAFTQFKAVVDSNKNSLNELMYKEDANQSFGNGKRITIYRSNLFQHGKAPIQNEDSKWSKKSQGEIRKGQFEQETPQSQMHPIFTPCNRQTISQEGGSHFAKSAKNSIVARRGDNKYGI